MRILVMKQGTPNFGSVYRSPRGDTVTKPHMDPIPGYIPDGMCVIYTEKHYI
jgi:hypothetical protein